MNDQPSYSDKAAREYAQKQARQRAEQDAQIAAFAANPCLALPQLEAALLRLAMPGTAKTKVRFQEREIEYNRGDLHVLRAEVQRLRVMCSGNPAARARQVTAPRNGFSPLGSLFSRYR